MLPVFLSFWNMEICCQLCSQYKGLAPFVQGRVSHLIRKRGLAFIFASASCLVVCLLCVKGRSECLVRQSLGTMLKHTLTNKTVFQILKYFINVDCKLLNVLLLLLLSNRTWKLHLQGQPVSLGKRGYHAEPLQWFAKQNLSEEMQTLLFASFW